MKQESINSSKLGLFVILGLTIFTVTIYFIGKQKNIFGSTFQLNVPFKTVSGLKNGNNVRFSGIDVGTVSDIIQVTDTSVLVILVIQKNVQPFIKTNAMASINSDGLMGDKVVSIYPGTAPNKQVEDDGVIFSRPPLDMDDLMLSVKYSVDNIGEISDQLAEFTYKLNNGKGLLSKLMTDEKMGKTLDATMSNLKSSAKGLNENMEAAKSNFLLKGYFNKKKREEEKKAAELKKKNN